VEFLRSRRTTTQVSLSRRLYAILGSYSPLIERSYGQVWPSFSPMKSNQPLLAARSHHQDSSDFHPRPLLPIRQDHTNLLQSSAYRPGRTGCLHTSLVGKHQGWGASGGLSRPMVGISSNLSASPAAEVLSLLNGLVTLERYGQIHHTNPFEYLFTCPTVGCRLKPEYIEASSTRTRSAGLLAYTNTSHAEPPGTTLLRSIWPPTAQNSCCILLSRKT
jgi:hypothetical protein